MLEIVGWASGVHLHISAYTTVHFDEMLNNGNSAGCPNALAKLPIGFALL
jgi:hypothetical protein